MTRVWFAATACVVLFGCGPTEHQKEARRIECLDKFCDGDRDPRNDYKTQALLKLNGQWFIGPSEYFSSGMNGAAFFWPSKTAARPSVSNFPEKALTTSGQADHVTIEIFLRRHDGAMHGPPRYERLQQAESEGRLISKAKPRQGLEIWRIREPDDRLPGIWYVASEIKETDGSPPVLWCSDESSKLNFCTTAFTWRPGIAADMRFHGKHAPAWPEIHQEAIRILQLLKKA